MAGTGYIPPPLSQGVGYGVVVGLGVAFALGMVGVTKLLKKSFGEDNKTTETFMVANRSVGTGLTASAVISSWLYSTALLGAPYLTYNYGIALPIWWANGQSVMICFFGFLSIKAKLHAPNAHTLLELIKVRYGTAAHILWIFLALINNILCFSCLIVGSSAAVSALTGVDIIAATYLLPLGVMVYTYFGGIRATFLTDYVHTFIIMILLVWFTIKTITVAEIGSIGSLFDAIQRVSKTRPVDGNHDGSYLTMTSEGAIYFGIIHIVTNYAIVIMDTGFWQKGFSADVASAVPGYIIGGNAYFAIPWAFGTIVGLGALALESTPVFPTYPRLMTAQEVSSGLVLPYTSQAVAGKSGAIAILLMIFMSTTSIASAQLIAMSSIFSFDIYGTYINKTPTDKLLIRWSHIGVVGSALFVSSFATACHKGGIDVNWLLYMLGTLVCPGTFPTCFTLLWKGQTKAAAIVSPIIGLVSGFAVWFGTAYAYSGEITITSTGATLPCMFGCLTSSLVPLPTTLAISFIWPDDTFQWSDFLQIKRVEASESNNEVRTHPVAFNVETYYTPERVAYMKHMSKVAAFWGIATFVGQVLLWPLPMYGAHMIFSKPFFTAWIVVSLIWLWLALFVANFYPLIDGGFHKIWVVLTGRNENGKGIVEGADSSENIPKVETVKIRTEEVRNI